MALRAGTPGQRKLNADSTHLGTRNGPKPHGSRLASRLRTRVQAVPESVSEVEAKLVEVAEG